MTVALDARPASYRGRPRYEGANIGTWVGFKQFVYLAEDAVLQYYRDRGTGPGRLFHDSGVQLSIVEHSVRLPGPVFVDDEVHAEATPAPGGNDAEDTFAVTLTVERDGQPVPVLKGKVRVAFVAPAGTLDAPPAEVAGRVVADPAALRPPAEAPAAFRPGFRWSETIPYPHCQFSDRMQHSGYVRDLEEVVHRYLADRGISIRRMLTERNWIPAVTRSQVRLLADAYLEEELHTVFTVDDIVKDVMFTGRMDCYVVRDGRIVHTATGSITHGYGVASGPDAGQVAVMDAQTQAALLWSAS
ncbi:thioesterase [Micromonospora sp. NPDC048999]|uniref:thioesterase n=1 Tax=Micromonospora sp. NPDC048999 TaxID=3155391 RepID=UPI0033D44AFF